MKVLNFGSLNIDKVYKESIAPARAGALVYHAGRQNAIREKF